MKSTAWDGEHAARISRPRLRADYTLVRLHRSQGDCALLIGEGRSLLFEEALEIELLGRLDGSVEVPDILAALAPSHHPASVAAGLRKLNRLGVLGDGRIDVDPLAAALWDARGVDPQRAEAWSAEGRILLVSVGGADISAVEQQFGILGVKAEPIRDTDPALAMLVEDCQQPLVVVPASILDDGLARLNRLCIQAARDWTLLRPHGLVLILGPHFAPRRTGCWECLRERWQANEQVENFLQQAAGHAGRLVTARARTRATSAAVVSLLAAELPVLVELGWSPRISGRLIALDSRDLTTTSHELARQPQCPACGDPALGNEICHFGADPADEAATPGPAQLLARLERHISPYLGVISRLVPLESDGAAPTYTYSSSHAFVLGEDTQSLRANLRGLSGGKGRTAEEAKLGAVGEAIERVCGLWQPSRPVRRGSFTELRDSGAVHPRRLHLFSDLQYGERQTTNPRRPHFHRVPCPLPDDRVIDWTQAWSLTADAPRLLPSAYCWYGHPETSSAQVSSADSNGCAAGTSKSDAVIRGFTELVERDSVALWWYHRSVLPGVDLNSFADPWIDRVREHYEQKLDRSLWVLDLTTDLGLPAYVAVSGHRSRPTDDVIFGFGCGLSAAKGLCRALAELNQFLPTVARFHGGRTHYGMTEPAAIRWFTGIRIDEQAWLRPCPSSELTTAASHPDLSPNNAGRLGHCLDIVSAAGLELIALDQSRPDIELPVVRTVVPGLRHFWRRLGPGRLWTIPPQLGRSPIVTDQATVNPLDIFF